MGRYVICMADSPDQQYTDSLARWIADELVVVEHDLAHPRPRARFALQAQLRLLKNMQGTMSEIQGALNEPQRDDRA
jgi:hypothetical protein